MQKHNLNENTIRYTNELKKFNSKIQTYTLLSTHNKKVCLKSSLIKQNS